MIDDVAKSGRHVKLEKSIFIGDGNWKSKHDKALKLIASFSPQEKAIITLLSSQSFSSLRLLAQWDIFMKSK